MKKVLVGLVLLAIGFSLGFFVGSTHKNAIHKDNLKIDKENTNLNETHIITQAEMDEQAYQEWKKTDDELNKVYNQVLKKYKNDKVFISKLQKAELAWMKYRDAYIESIYPADDKSFYGSVYPVCVNMTAAEIIQERIDQLKFWLKGREEGDVCSGSRGWE